jgi:hypothetical protein
MVCAAQGERGALCARPEARIAFADANWLFPFIALGMKVLPARNDLDRKIMRQMRD